MLFTESWELGTLLGCIYRSFSQWCLVVGSFGSLDLDQLDRCPGRLRCSNETGGQHGVGLGHKRHPVFEAAVK